MRVAVSGSHSTGKSTLIAAFIARRPGYTYEPEAFETLADDMDLISSGPTLEALQSLVHYTAAELARHPSGARVIHERSPVDYLAYAAVSREGRSKSEAAAFFAACLPVVRRAVRDLDLIVLLPASATGPIRARPGENGRLRRRVDRRLRRSLIDNDDDLFGAGDPPHVVELSPWPERQLAELIRLTDLGESRRDSRGGPGIPEGPGGP
jgi:hypothetical protein